jgi:hypothetical protein
VTFSRPFIPAAAWPGTVHRYSYVPAFATVTVSLADWPGEISAGIFLPAQTVAVAAGTAFVQSSKSCGRLPL